MPGKLLIADFNRSAMPKKDNQVLSIPITSDIGWGFDFNDLVSALRGFSGRRIEIPINSFGGNVFEGLAIYNTLIGRKETVHTKVIGYALSMGSTIMMAGSRRIMPEEGFVMIHNPMMVGAGDHEDMAHMSSVLNSMTQDLAGITARTTGLELDQVLEMMEKETWLTSSEALEMGFATHITKGAKFTAMFSKQELETYKNIPRQLVSRKSHHVMDLTKVTQGLRDVLALLDTQPPVQPVATAQPVVQPVATETPPPAVQPVAQPVATAQPVVQPVATAQPVVETPPPAAQPVATAQPVAQPVATVPPVEETPPAQTFDMQGAIAGIQAGLTQLTQGMGNMQGQINQLQTSNANLSQRVAQMQGHTAVLPGAQTTPVVQVTAAEQQFQKQLNKVFTPGNEVKHERSK